MTALQTCPSSSHGSWNTRMPLQAGSGESRVVEFVAVQILM